MNAGINKSAGSLSALISLIKPWQSRLAALVLAVLVSLSLRYGLTSPLDVFEEQVGNLGWHLAPATQTEERFNIIAIDEKSLQEIGHWPWPRSTLAELSRRLHDAGVPLQIYDIFFPETSAGDAEFAEALQNGPAVLSQAPYLQNLQNPAQKIRAGNLGSPLSGIACSQATKAGFYDGNAAAFDAIAKGNVTPVVDADGAIRKVPAYVCVDDQPYAALEISALLKAINVAASSAAVKPGNGLFSASQSLSFDFYPGLEIPLDARGNIRVSFKNSPDVYNLISATDVLHGRVDPALLNNTWSLIGLTALGLLDNTPTPYSGEAPGVELHARLLSSILDNNVPYSPRAATLLLTLLCGVFAVIVWLLASAREKVASYGLVASIIVLPLAAIFLHAQLLSAANVWLGWLAPALFGFCASSFLLLHEYAWVRLERSRVLDNLSSYLPAEVAAEIAYALPNSSIDAQRTNATLLSADLRNFSAYTEIRPPEESAALLHFFFVKTTEIIEKHHGRVHEFKGDSLLAKWDGSDTAAAVQALEASYEMQRIMVDVLPQHPPAGLEPLALGIGIEQGPVLIGSIGPAHRRSHTMLGQTVTITLRIQEMTADLAQPILVGECAARQLAEQGLISQGSYLLNGLRNPHILYAPPMRDPVKHTARTDTTPLKLLRGGRS